MLANQGVDLNARGGTSGRGESEQARMGVARCRMTEARSR